MYFLIGLGIFTALGIIIDRINLWWDRRAIPDPDPLEELRRAYADELAVWDQEFQRLTGQSVFNLLHPDLADRSQAYMAMMQKALQNSAQQQAGYGQAGNPYVGLGGQQGQLGQGYLGGLGGMFGAIGNNWRH